MTISNNNIKTKLIKSGANFVRFVDISVLPNEQNKGFRIKVK